MIVCTSGDFYGTADVFNEPKSHFVAEMMGKLGYDAVAVGEMDLNFGLAALVRDARSNNLPMVCANLMARGDSLRIRTGGPADATADRLGTAFPPYLVVERAGTRFGFLGLLSPATRAVRNIGEAPKKLESLTYVIEDPLEIARQVAPELRARCDVMVVLAHMSEEDGRALAADIAGIDFMILGHDPQGHSIGEPIMVGSTAIVRASYQGMYIGELGIQLAGNRMEDYRNRLYPLISSFPDDPEMAKQLDEFDEENRQRQKELYAREQLKQADAGTAGNRYLGVGTCQSCHLEAFEVYMKTAHATAYHTLSSQFVHRDTNCVGCHVTGYGEPGGFTGIRPRGAMVDLVDVQCEACHGPGSEHSRDGSYREAAVGSCVKCHTESDDPEFDYDTDWPKVAH